MTRRLRRSTALGFTLIELMIVVAIVAILASLATAGYRFAVIKARRAEAANCVTEMAQMLERNYATTLRYDQDASGNAYAPSPQCRTSLADGGFYAFAIVADRTSYTITAAPGSNQDDPKCGELGLSQDGRKTITGSASPSDCW